MVADNEFHRVGPEAVKILRPHLVVLERGTAISPCVAMSLITVADTGVV